MTSTVASNDHITTRTRSHVSDEEDSSFGSNGALPGHSVFVNPSDTGRSYWEEEPQRLGELMTPQVSPSSLKIDWNGQNLDEVRSGAFCPERSSEDCTWPTQQKVLHCAEDPYNADSPTNPETRGTNTICDRNEIPVGTGMTSFQELLERELVKSTAGETQEAFLSPKAPIKSFLRRRSRQWWGKDRRKSMPTDNKREDAASHLVVQKTYPASKTFLDVIDPSPCEFFCHNRSSNEEQIALVAAESQILLEVWHRGVMREKQELESFLQSEHSVNGSTQNQVASSRVTSEPLIPQPLNESVSADAQSDLLGNQDFKDGYTSLLPSSDLDRWVDRLAVNDSVTMSEVTSSEAPPQIENQICDTSFRDSQSVVQMTAKERSDAGIRSDEALISPLVKAVFECKNVPRQTAKMCVSNAQEKLAVHTSETVLEYTIAQSQSTDKVVDELVMRKVNELEREISQYKAEAEALRAETQQIKHDREILLVERNGLEEMKKRLAADFQVWKEEEARKMQRRNRLMQRQLKTQTVANELKDSREVELLKAQIVKVSAEKEQKMAKWKVLCERQSKRIKRKELEANVQELKEEVRFFEQERLNTWPRSKKQDGQLGACSSPAQSLSKVCSVYATDGRYYDPQKYQEPDIWQPSVAVEVDPLNNEFRAYLQASTHPAKIEISEKSESLSELAENPQNFKRAKNECSSPSSTNVENLDLQAVLPNGTKVIHFRNGTTKEIHPNGHIIVRFTNGDIKKTYPDSGMVVYYYADAETTHTTYSNSVELFEFPNNQIEKHYPSGRKEIYFPDGTEKVIHENGDEESLFPDGTRVVTPVLTREEDDED